MECRLRARSWIVLRDASEPDIVGARKTTERVTDEMIPAMVTFATGTCQVVSAVPYARSSPTPVSTATSAA
jgi:hypothetical protein